MTKLERQRGEDRRHQASAAGKEMMGAEREEQRVLG